MFFLKEQALADCEDYITFGRTWSYKAHLSDKVRAVPSLKM